MKTIQFFFFFNLFNTIIPNIIDLLNTNQYSMFDPFEQFENFPVIATNFICPAMKFTVLSFYITLSLTVLIHLFDFSSNSLLDILFDKLMGFIKTLLSDNAFTFKNAYFYNFAFLFLFILTSNLIGLIPFNWTLTSWISIVFFISFSYFFFINVIFITKNKWTFAAFTQPSGTPLLINPFLTIVEIISYLSRAISLTVRLFANMLSGHALIKILILFSWVSLTTGTASAYLICLTIWLLVVIIFFLEILVGFLQAYVFTLLVSIYFSDSIAHEAH